MLKILAGKHMVGGRDVVRVLNSSAFHDTQLVCSGDLAYLGESWSKTIGSVVSSYTCKWNFIDKSMMANIKHVFSQVIT